MKKKMAILMVIFACFTMLASGCGPSKEKQAFRVSQEVYTALNEAADLCGGVLKSVYNAWYFSIYKYNDFEAQDILSETCAAAFAKEVGVSLDELKLGFRNIVGVESDDASYDHLLGVSLESFSSSVGLVVETYKHKGAFDQISDKLDSAKEALKKINEVYPEYEHYATLKKFNTSVVSCRDFCMSPGGTFEQLKDTKSGYENDFKAYKAELSFDFE